MIDDAFVIDCIAHPFNVHKDNCVSDWGDGIADMLWGFHTNWNLPGEQVPYEVYRSDISAEVLARTLFLETETDIAVNHALPVHSLYKDGMVSRAKNKELHDRWPDRFINYATVDPTLGLDACFKALDEQMTDEVPNAVGLKLYPGRVEPHRFYRLDDEELCFPLFEKCRDEYGIKVIAIHKAMPLGAVPMAPFKLDDVDSAATSFPDLQFEIVHAGWAFNQETAFLLARYPNVWGNLECTSMLVNGGPGVFEDMLATMVFWGGADKMMMSGGAMYTHPQGMLRKFWDLEFSDAVLEKYSPIPQLTKEQKTGILGGNYARMLGLDIEAMKAKIADDEFSQERRERGLAKPWSNWMADARAKGIVEEPAAVAS